jgi:GDP/GTP exchange factor Sec2p
MICPNCKCPIPRDPEQLQTIQALESQLQELSQKLAMSGRTPVYYLTTVDKVADLEDELEAVRRNTPTPNSLTRTTSIPLSQSTIPEPTPTSRLGSFLASRRPIFASTRSSPAVMRTLPVRLPSPNNLSLEEQLQHERSARELAEEKVVSMTQELEELTQSLFEEANAMVRSEKEKVARLSEKVSVLESREDDKRRRLTELERAVGRIARVRGLLENKENKENGLLVGVQPLGKTVA